MNACIEEFDVAAKTELNVETESSTAIAGISTVEDNGHSTGHQDKEKGYMCHKCMIEAWRADADDDELPTLDSHSTRSSVDEYDDSEELDRCPTPSSMDRLLQPVDSRPSDRCSPHSPSMRDSSVRHLSLPPRINMTHSPGTPDSHSSARRSPVVPQLAHLSLMDNPFEQKINIKTIEQYNQALTQFWTTTATLLGPDFDYTYGDIAANVGHDAVAYNARVGEPATTSWPLSPTINVGKSQRNIMGKELFSRLEGMGMAWRWFEYESAVQKYIDVRIRPGHSWDFGYCYEGTDGAQHCVVMHVNVNAEGQQRIYEGANDNPATGTKDPAATRTSRFWWCRPHPTSKDRDIKRRARDKRLNERYAQAKRCVVTYRSKDEPQHRFALEDSQANLHQDLEVRERVEGRDGIRTMNTVLQLADSAEALGQLDVAVKWNRDLVARRAKRLGDTSRDTCYARFKLAQLLIKAEQWDEAKMVAMENIHALAGYEESHPLFCRQHIQACSIAMKRRRVDVALSAMQYLPILEQHHSSDLKTRELALQVIVEAQSFKHNYTAVVEHLPQLIALYTDDSPVEKQHLKLQYQHALASALNRTHCPLPAIATLKSALALAKSLSLPPTSLALLDVHALLGTLHFEQKEWNAAQHYLESAAKGYRAVLGRESEKYVRTKEVYLQLRAAMKVRLGLAERLIRQKRKQALEAREREMRERKASGVVVERRPQMKLRDLIPGGQAS